MTSLLHARRVSIEGRLKPTNLECSSGEMIAVIGPNGAGKTSLIRAVAAIELENGTVEIDGENVVDALPLRKMRLLSFLPATRGLVWPISARDVIALGHPSPDAVRIQEVIDLFELGVLADRPVNCLSTGERCRVLLARSLAARPRLLLLDEPLSNLDLYWVLMTLQILREQASVNGCAVLASLHNLEQMGAFDRVLLMHDGRIIESREPEDMLASKQLAATFRLDREGAGWQLREPMPADRRSSP